MNGRELLEVRERLADLEEGFGLLMERVAAIEAITSPPIAIVPHDMAEAFAASGDMRPGALIKVLGRQKAEKPQ